MGQVKIAIVDGEVINAETPHEIPGELRHKIFGKHMKAKTAWKAS